MQRVVLQKLGCSIAVEKVLCCGEGREQGEGLAGTMRAGCASRSGWHCVGLCIAGGIEDQGHGAGRCSLLQMTCEELRCDGACESSQLATKLHTVDTVCLYLLYLHLVAAQYCNSAQQQQECHGSEGGVINGE